MNPKGMMIRYEGGEFDSGDLMMIERMENGDVEITLQGIGVQRHSGLAAQQIWAQVTEQAETLEDIQADQYDEIVEQVRNKAQKK